MQHETHNKQILSKEVQLPFFSTTYKAFKITGRKKQPSILMIFLRNPSMTLVESQNDQQSYNLPNLFPWKMHNQDNEPALQMGARPKTSVLCPRENPPKSTNRSNLSWFMQRAFAASERLLTSRKFSFKATNRFLISLSTEGFDP